MKRVIAYALVVPAVVCVVVLAVAIATAGAIADEI